MEKFHILKLLDNAESHSTCLKRKVGAVLLSDGWYKEEGANKVTVNSDTTEHICKLCLTQGINKEACPAIHAEINCLTRADEVYGMLNKTLLVSYSPCPECCKAIILAGISTVVVKEPRVKQPDLATRVLYNVETYDELAKRLFMEASVKYIRLWECREGCEVV